MPPVRFWLQPTISFAFYKPKHFYKPLTTLIIGTPAIHDRHAGIVTQFNWFSSLRDSDFLAWLDWSFESQLVRTKGGVLAQNILTSLVRKLAYRLLMITAMPRYGSNGAIVWLAPAQWAMVYGLMPPNVLIDSYKLFRSCNSGFD